MSDSRGAPAHLATDRPLLSGEAFVDESGEVHHLAEVVIVVTDASGTVHRVPLRRNGDQWWAPYSRP